MTKTDKVAFIGGTEAPLIARYKAGFEQGAKYVKPDVEVLVSYIGGYNSFNNPKKAEQITNELIRENTDVFYHAAGASNRGIVNSAKKYGKYVIEVSPKADGDLVVGLTKGSCEDEAGNEIEETLKIITMIVE